MTVTLSDVQVIDSPGAASMASSSSGAGSGNQAKAAVYRVDGNGGADFNLVDLSGNKISSGIYFYRIVQLDETGTEGEEKLGKFAVVR